MKVKSIAKEKQRKRNLNKQRQLKALGDKSYRFQMLIPADRNIDVSQLNGCVL